MSENIRLALKGIWSHRLRSFLTMLGVIIGIASIIAIVSTIKGTNEQIMQNLIGAGNNNVTVSLRQGDSDYWMDAGVPANVIPVTESQKKEIYELDSVVDASFYLKRSYAESISAGSNALSGGSLFGIDTHYLSTTGYIAYKGRSFLEQDYIILLLQLLQCLPAVVSFLHGIALRLQVYFQGRDNISVIIADQYFHHPFHLRRENDNTILIKKKDGEALRIV